MILPVYASLERMDPALIEAGQDLYGSPLRDVPARHRGRTTFQGVLPASCSSSCPAVGDFVSAQLLGGPNT